MGRSDEVAAGDQGALRIGQGLCQACVHQAQDLGGILGGHEQRWLALLGQFLGVKFGLVSAEIRAVAPDLRKDRRAG